MQEIGACPVEHRHEIVAHRMYALRREVAQALLVNLNLLVAVGTSVFDGLRHGQALHDAPSQPGSLDIFTQVANGLACPDFAERHIVQRGDNALDAYLSQHRERDLILLTKPTPSFFHN